MSGEKAVRAESSGSRMRRVHIECTGEARSVNAGDQRITTVPLLIRRKHNRKLLMPPPGQRSAISAALPDESMIRALGKAFYWKKLLDEGAYPTLRAMAEAIGLESGYVAEMIRMTTLAPDIIEAIANGRQPQHLNLHALRGRPEAFPRDWHEQRRLFGFAE